MADKIESIEGDSLLFATAAIWGFAFVAQRVGMQHVGPFTFNGVRYLVGAISLVPLFALRRAATRAIPPSRPEGAGGSPFAEKFAPPLLAGACMFLGSSLQQVGLVSTTAENAAFITSLYVVIVPFLAAVFGRKVLRIDWAASLIAVAGLWLITMRRGASIAPGDAFVMASAFFWALHIIVIGRFASTYDPIALSIGQFTISGLLSLMIAIPFERITFGGIRDALWPLLYGGLASCGVAFTLQILGQRRSKPSHASIILSLEGLFGAIGGIILLGEPATVRILAGGALMIVAATLPHVGSVAQAFARFGPPRRRTR